MKNNSTGNFLLNFIILFSVFFILSVPLAHASSNITKNNSKNQMAIVETQEAEEMPNVINSKERQILEKSEKKLSPINFMSYFLQLLVENGVSANTIFMILILPIIATIIAFARQVVGFESFGIYTPTIITLSFLSMGLVYGLVIFSIILITGTFTRMLARKMRLLYIPRMAILLTIVSLVIMLTYVVGIYLGGKNMIEVTVLPILLLIVLIENFIAAQMEKGNKEAIRLTVETLLLSVLCYYIVSWQPLKEIILRFPEIIFLTILINIMLGRWTGLRLFEYIRFRQLINEIDTEE